MLMLRRLTQLRATSGLRVVPGMRYSTVDNTEKKEVQDAESFNELHINQDKLAIERAALSGAPKELLERTVHIYQLAPPATQSGRAQQKGWRINWDIVPRANKWEDPIMGYAASADYMQATEIHFQTKEDAINFATRQGWNYYVREPKEREFHPKVYGDNFIHHKGPLKMIFTK